jgi:hypothetical protein
MSRKVKKEITSASFSMTKFYRRITTAKPSTLIVSLIAVSLAVFLFGGGVYDITIKPFPAVYVNSQFLFVYPQSLSDQFIAESLLAMILFVLGMTGLLLMYQSTKYAFKPRQAYMMFIMGAVFLFISYLVIETILGMKTG